MIGRAIVILKLTYLDTHVHSCHGVSHEFAYHLCVWAVILPKDKDGKKPPKTPWDSFGSCGLWDEIEKNYHCPLKWPKTYILYSDKQTPVIAVE